MTAQLKRDREQRARHLYGSAKNPEHKTARASRQNRDSKGRLTKGYQYPTEHEFMHDMPIFEAPAAEAPEIQIHEPLTAEYSSLPDIPRPEDIRNMTETERLEYANMLLTMEEKALARRMKPKRAVRAELNPE
jgi:hypothetical protein